MGVFDTWAEYVVKVLQAESEYSGALAGHPTLLGDARETIVKGVLKRILPAAFEVGRGQVIDSDGNTSKQIDIVIARSDSPALLLPSGDKVYLVESVLATIEVKSALTKKELFMALNNCASIADLNPRVHAPSRAKILERMKITEDEGGVMRHDDPLELQRYSLKGYPATYIFGFKEYTNNVLALAEAVDEWIGQQHAAGRTLHLRHLPALIATEGCFGCRNEVPFVANVDPVQKPGNQDKPHQYLFGKETVPLRLMTAHLLATLYAKIPWGPDIEGLQMEPRRYIEQMTYPGYEYGLSFGDPPPGVNVLGGTGSAGPNPAPAASGPASADPSPALAEDQQS